MSRNTAVNPQKRSDKALKSISRGNAYSKVGFVALLVLYVLTSLLMQMVLRNAGGVFSIMGNDIPIGSFAGVVSSMSNFCLIFLVVFYKKPGFIVAMTISGVWLLWIIQGMVVQHIVGNNLSGLFTGLFAMVVMVIIYLNNVRNEKYQERLRKQAITDALTGLPNRFACSEYIEQLVDRGEKFAVVSVDLNNFKSINDTMGQSAGDEVLKKIATRMKDAADAGMSSTNDFVTHQGGDEFTVIIQNYRTEEDIKDTIEYYESVIEEKLTIESYDYVVTASFGYAMFPADAKDGDTLYTYADAAMYAAKRMSGTVRMCRFTPELVGAEHSLEIERKIRAALESDRMHFNLQPQFDIEQNLRGFEALARLKDEDGSIVSPAEFIPVAEKVGLVDQIDACIFRNAARFLGELIEITGTDITLSVNVSGRHLMKSDFVEEVQGIIDETSVPAKQIEIEITESIMIDSLDKALDSINKVKKMGVKVAIDDFGTGYSSLSYLNTFPADLLKVDKSFIDKMNSSDSSKQYVAAIISIGHIMNFDVISEGVEEPDQLETLRTIGCDFIQGFLWGRPMEPEDARELVMRSVHA